MDFLLAPTAVQAYASLKAVRISQVNTDLPTDPALITATLTAILPDPPLLSETLIDPPAPTELSVPTDTWTSTATAAPPPSETSTATDTPGPIATATETPTPSNTETPAATAPPTLTPPATVLAPATDVPTPTLIPVPTATFTVVATIMPAVSTPPPLLISEFMADPKAVSDTNGEWFELYNPTADTVNLHDWVLKDLGGDHHTINVDLLIQPGAYLVLGRNQDLATNGGVPVAYVYTGLTLANSTDELLLLAPDGTETDRVSWGDAAGLAITLGASNERTNLAEPAQWATANTPWSGSAGDRGTPGSLYVPAPLVTVTSTPLSANTWPPVETASLLQIEEVAYDGADEEFIALLNTGDGVLDLTGWVVGDAALPGGGEGMYALPTGYQLNPGALFVIARNAETFQRQWHQPPDAEFEDHAVDVPSLARRRDLASGSLALSDSGDEVVLLNPGGQLADAVAFTNGNYTALHLSGELRPAKGYSLQRVPGATFPTVTDVRQRFLYASPQPFAVESLPAPQRASHPALSDGLSAVWGSLGAHSNFSPGYTAPPHYLLAAAAASGLDFVAIADTTPAQVVVGSNAILAVPAWSWQDGADVQAVIYGNAYQPIEHVDGLLDFLTTSGLTAQWQNADPPSATSITAIAADDSAAPGALTTLYKQWQATNAALLPAGNANPPLPGAIDPAPRYTGLAVTSLDPASVLQAMAAHRGWLTSSPGLWLTVKAELENGEQRWMGSLLPPSNKVTLHIQYGDRSGEMAGLAVWQNNKPIQPLDEFAKDGQWSLTLPALPDSLLYVVAIQADGDFAVTAPLRVGASNNNVVLLNEVLPGPGGDLNGDQLVDGNDEFIELYNPGSEPIALGGWQLSDANGDKTPNHHFTFSVGRYINGGEHMVLWRQESHINQNHTDDYVRLLNQTGEEVDRISWAVKPNHGLSISRLPDGQSWKAGTKVTPGEPNARANQHNDSGPAPAATPIPKPPGTEHVVPDIPTLEPNYGQASGPPASVAQAKLAGLEKSVEFRAIVIAPPGLYNASIYVADPAPNILAGPYAGIGINVYLRKGEFPALQVGDQVLVRGTLRSFRGEMELQLDRPEQIWRIGPGLLLQPLPLTLPEIGESVEGRLVTFTGMVSSWQGDSLYLVDPANPSAPPVRVTIRSSLAWKRPYVQKGQLFTVTGVVSQMASNVPWNGGYRVLVRFKEDLVKILK
ncbi:MAG: lamin tail domain-containing protein [Chloroflexi bacterium]|nr:lamin tail domain-containing protein [Chloroflexota bacterium]